MTCDLMPSPYDSTHLLCEQRFLSHESVYQRSTTFSAADFNHIMRSVYLNHSYKELSPDTSSSVRHNPLAEAPEFYKQIPASLVSSLRKLYRLDIEMNGYPPDPPGH